MYLIALVWARDSFIFEYVYYYQNSCADIKYYNLEILGLTLADVEKLPWLLEQLPKMINDGDV